MYSQYLDYAKAVREEIFQHINQPLWHEKSLKDVSKIVIILSSPRSGSSLLFYLLSQMEELLSLNGEHTTYYKLNGYSFPFRNFQSDFLGNPKLSKEEFNNFSRDFLSSVGVGSEKVISKPEELKEFTQILALRLPIQWPQLALSVKQWLWYITEALRQYSQRHLTWNSSKFIINLFKKLITFYPNFNPFYYDLSPSLLKSHFPNISCPNAPPNAHFCIEEPPFIVLKPRRRPTSEEISSKPWLLKASIDAFRIPLLKQLFPNAEFKIIHLTRFSATSINGLYDGWNHRGFFSHNLEGIANLSIQGYSDVYEWGKHWWSYELPPPWKEVINQPLEYVCGLQWFSSHQSILENLKREQQTNILRVQFEDIISSNQQRLQTFRRILEFIGIDNDNALKKVVDEMQPVMCSVPSDETRWLNRKSLILPVIIQESIRCLTNELGYGNILNQFR